VPRRAWETDRLSPSLRYVAILSDDTTVDDQLSPPPYEATASTSSGTESNAPAPTPNGAVRAVEKIAPGTKLQDRECELYMAATVLAHLRPASSARDSASSHRVSCLSSMSLVPVETKQQCSKTEPRCCLQDSKLYGKDVRVLGPDKQTLE
jgi:hypothetical protein